MSWQGNSNVIIQPVSANQCLGRVILMGSHNIGFCVEILKFILLIWSILSDPGALHSIAYIHRDDDNNDKDLISRG